MASIGHELRRRAAVVPAHQAAVILLPVALWILIPRLGPARIDTAIGALLGLGFIALVARRPGPSLLILIPWLLFQQAVLAWLYENGVPPSVLRPAAALKDGVLAGVLVAAVLHMRRTRGRFDGLDKLALGYLACVTAYFLVPQIAGGTPLPLADRFLAFRIDVYFVLLFLGLRHAPISAADRRRALQAAIVIGTIGAAVAIYEYLQSAAWNDFAINTLGVQRYKTQVLGTYVQDPLDVRYHDRIAGAEYTRSGSLLFAPVPLGLYLVIAYAVAVVRSALGRASLLAHVGLAVLGFGIIFTFTRAAMAGLVIVPLVVFRVLPERFRAVRARYGLVMLTALVILVPVLISSGAADRIMGNDDNSGSGHVDSVVEGYGRLFTTPLGNGLGSAPGIGDRFQVSTKLTSHNSYLQVGNELGIFTLIVFVALVVALIRRLRQAADGDPPDVPIATIALAAGVALALAGAAQHVWIEVPVAWMFWALAGLAVGAHDAASAPAVAPRRSLVTTIRS